MSVDFYRDSPGKFDSRTLNRKTLDRCTGRIRNCEASLDGRLRRHHAGTRSPKPEAYIHTHIYTYLHILYIYIYIHTYICICTHMQRPPGPSSSRSGRPRSQRALMGVPRSGGLIRVVLSLGYYYVSVLLLLDQYRCYRHYHLHYHHLVWQNEGGPKEWGSQATAGSIVGCSQLSACSGPAADRCSSPLRWGPLSSLWSEHATITITMIMIVTITITITLTITNIASYARLITLLVHASIMFTIYRR